MSTDDSFSRITTLESALAEEKASHTDTLVKLRLTEERLAASEAERERLKDLVAPDPLAESALVFPQKRGTDLLTCLCDDDSRGSGMRRALFDELDVLLLEIELDAPFSFHDDAPTEPMAAREPG